MDLDSDHATVSAGPGVVITAGFGDQTPAPHHDCDNNQVILDQDPSAPMDWDSDNDSDLQTQTHTTIQPLSLTIDLASLGQSEFDLH